jgi:hypothetical protein
MILDRTDHPCLRVGCHNVTRGVRWCVRSFLLCLFTTPMSPTALPQLLHHGAIKLAVATAQPTSSLTISHRLPASFPTAEKEKREQRNRSEITRWSCWGYMGSPLFPLCSMTESGWLTSEVAWEHPQNLVSQGYMTVAELATCHVSKDTASPPTAGGYIMACVAFYEWGFGMPSHQFLCSLL